MKAITHLDGAWLGVIVADKRGSSNLVDQGTDLINGSGPIRWPPRVEMTVLVKGVRGEVGEHISGSSFKSNFVSFQSKDRGSKSNFWTKLISNIPRFLLFRFPF